MPFTTCTYLFYYQHRKKAYMKIRSDWFIQSTNFTLKMYLKTNLWLKIDIKKFFLIHAGAFSLSHTHTHSDDVKIIVIDCLQSS